MYVYVFMCKRGFVFCSAEYEQIKDSDSERGKLCKAYAYGEPFSFLNEDQEDDGRNM
jgi:hypothetical protein